MKRITSLLLVTLFLLNLIPTAFAAGTSSEADEAAPAEVVSSDTTWSYWDQETDPVINSEMYQKYPVRILWAYGMFLQDTSWKWASGPFGAQDGAMADLGGGCTPKTLLTQYKGDGTDIEAYFFVTTFEVSAEQLSETQQILGSLYYDDSAVVYLNGGKVAAFDEPEGGFSQNMEYGGSNASAPKLGEFTLTDISALKEGTNVLAVEVHQGSSSSSDIYFDFQSLALSTEAPDYSNLPLEQDTAALSVGGSETEMNFTWYASSEEAGTISYAPASELVDGAMPENAATATAAATAANRGGYYSNQLTLTGLQPDTTYAYQLTNTKGEEVVTSNIATFTTGGGETTRFLFVGDPQLGSSGNLSSDTTGWDTTLNKAAAMFPDATFLLSAGDQVDAAASEEQYQSYLNRSVLSSLPQATTIGNHDSSSNSYDQHFNVANESTEYGTTNAGGDNWFVYNNVLFMDLNSNDLSTAEHKAFMEEAIAANPNVSWKIVVFHHSIYSVASHAEDSDILQRRDELAPVFQELDIDVVLMGHDHVYTRSYMMDGLTPMTDASIYDDANYSSITDPTGILYVTANSASGSKYYEISGQYAYAAVQNQEKVPNVSYVEMDDSHFTITTYRTSDMSVVDTFTINRTSGSSSDGLPFTDVKSGSWFEDAVDYVYAKGMMTGTSATTFAPNSTTTRGMIVTILYRLENEPAAGTTSFTDVASSAYYAKAVAWAAENGVVTGTTETTFAPNSPITREQMAAILYRYAALKGYDVSQKADLSGYTDAGTVSAYASDALAWTNAQGLITGVTGTTLAPRNSATRAQVATLLMRFCETIAQ